jgi:S1-C subfamily serine protease
VGGGGSFGSVASGGAVSQGFEYDTSGFLKTYVTWVCAYALMAAMDVILRKLALGVVVVASVACTSTTPDSASFSAPNDVTRKMVRERISAVVVTGRKEIGSWTNQRFAISNAPKDADGGSAAPVSDDGYFLTADHVLVDVSGKNIFIIYANGGNIITAKARVVWRSAKDDIALLHISKKTPYYYRWTSPDHGISQGLPVMHGGMATVKKSNTGKLQTKLGAESWMTGARTFKMDIPLEPGDSGGPVIDASGQLIGINSAVEFLIPLETAIFLDSEGVRPSIRNINERIQVDRNANR